MPMFAKRHYEAIAHCLGWSIARTDSPEAWLAIVDEITAMLKRDTHHFNAEKFREAVVAHRHIRRSISGA